MRKPRVGSMNTAGGAIVAAAAAALGRHAGAEQGHDWGDGAAIGIGGGGSSVGVLLSY